MEKPTMTALRTAWFVRAVLLMPKNVNGGVRLRVRGGVTA